ncbi:hypothetical protein [Streptomyces sp. MBT53]|uniref:hypothetical protein n=1 Tax=Streptomyces sp. MBT53 TaxID=1488384 RepID=UPI0019134803|nr:hypothetical protein [Streptomyces sp. MBT53]MBK6016786.1 hypothetical protein [Streptomyces sp. MBT53]
MTLRFCRYCDEPITDPHDAVHLWHEEGMSGPGRDVWAHREHAGFVEPNTVLVRILARVLIAERRRP